MKLRSHSIPCSEDMIKHIGVSPDIIATIVLFRQTLNLHYAKDIDAIRQQLEDDQYSKEVIVLYKGSACGCSTSVEKCK